MTPPLPWSTVDWPVAVEPDDNPTTEAKVELGRLLFYDPILSSDGAVACATCHSEVWGMSDGLVVSIGVDGTGPTGPGRVGPNATDRNSQTLWNAAYRQNMFWDGRTDGLEVQALQPIEEPVELGRRSVAEAVDAIAAIDEYRVRFDAIFPSGVTGPNLGRVLASFQRTMVTDWAPYDRYVAGDAGAMSDEAIEGMFLFAEVGCSDCHVPPLFEAEDTYAVRRESEDEGRAFVTRRNEDRGAFRTTTLRNLRETGPYFHDGSVVRLEDAVADEVSRAAGAETLDADDVARIARFLSEGLMDRSREPDRPETVPSGLPVPKDGFRIPR
ncbi:MAG: cytochrome-c peroxidase [Myxococcota bacterium]